MVLTIWFYAYFLALCIFLFTVDVKKCVRFFLLFLLWILPIKSLIFFVFKKNCPMFTCICCGFYIHVVNRSFSVVYLTTSVIEIVVLMTNKWTNEKRKKNTGAEKNTQTIVVNADANLYPALVSCTFGLDLHFNFRKLW